jgi:hypothetical protein
MPITNDTRPPPPRQPRRDPRAKQPGAQGIAYREPRSVPPDRLAGRVAATTPAFLCRSTWSAGHLHHRGHANRARDIFRRTAGRTRLLPCLRSSDGRRRRHRTVGASLDFANLGTRRVVGRRVVVATSAEFCVGMKAGTTPAPTGRPRGACRSSHSRRSASGPALSLS